MWDEMVKWIRKVAKGTLGESRGFGRKDKESWLWDASMQDKVKNKRECFKEWSLLKMLKIGKSIRQLRKIL